MQTKVASFAFASLLLAMVGQPGASAADRLRSPAVFVDGSALVPVRQLAETLQARLEFVDPRITIAVVG
ncbi:MAG: hypothetical protein IT204_10365 [Fimbriimonadaceae bacterium]|nr:hypothetical protein [Fimbriimonadaceae bacterium]